jgi:hypothetical protein
MTTLRSLLLGLGLSAVSIAGLAGSAIAADSKPSPAQVAIKSLIGKWTGNGTIQSEGKTHKVTMSWDCVAAAGGTGAKCKASIVGIPGFTYEFDDLWALSPADGLVHWYTITNAGEVHDHQGHLDTSGGQLAAHVAVGGKMLSEVITFRCSKSSFVMSWVTTLGGAPHESGQIELSK